MEVERESVRKALRLLSVPERPGPLPDGKGNVMRRSAQIRLGAALSASMLAAAAIAGCQTPDQGRDAGLLRPYPAHATVSPGLVLAGPVLQGEPTDADETPERWELARNDDQLGGRSRRGSTVKDLIEIRSRDRIRSTGAGRVRDTSSTNVRTIIRRRVE